ncbi:MAG: UDP-N-acetylmuramoyl-L-alanyl-D-glutamate--2,6-diaminopimelate ligase [Prevotellaceae bacterium]|jgi:UDP-N-acetylmuramoyl-L-alanyl-D-glutamate--2,6-diaminopimelate ligase|nr:UDP-N-acetylmuramoyl-L-alanyl-D-glutamate--2,6-diaminopimelate ligase [Prevotellaceae bacterium]
MLRLNLILKNIVTDQIIGDVTVEINNICFDSRQVQVGDVFVATKGTSVDGHEYIGQATEKGAVAIVCEDIPRQTAAGVTYIKVDDSADALGKMAANRYGNPSEKLNLIGVTGTNGKTTTVTLLYQLFKELGYQSGLISTVLNRIDDRVVEASHTTPDAPELNRLLAEMVSAGCQYAFMEVSSHAIEQKRISGVKFKGGIFTNITRDHIDYHQTFDNYLHAKKTFFDGLSKDTFALTNIDDKNGLVMLQNTKARKYTYSLRNMADFKTRILDDGFDGMLLDVNHREVHVPFIGRFNAYNLTAVFGCAVALGQDEVEVLRIISALRPVSGRFETLRSPSGYTAIVDYAHTPDALSNVIGTINEILHNKGRLITVVGCGGNRDKGKRPLMAQEAVDGSWKTVLTSDNPRFEEPQTIIDDMLTGLDNDQKKQTLVIVDRREAIRTACTIAQAGDIVLIAGKGHEDYQIIQGVKHHFDDKEEVLNCF